MKILTLAFFLTLGALVVVGCGGSKTQTSAQKLSNEGMQTLPSGLMYRVVKEGTGATPKATDKVRVHYRGQFPDGKEFDSSYSRGEPIEFDVTGVIKGWTEALQLMKEGASWQLCIPPGLAYGEMGAPPAIPPGATLYFDVELLKVISAD